MSLRSSLEQKSVTAMADTQFNLVSLDRWYMFIDIFVTTNPVNIGDVTGQNATINPGDVYTIPWPVNLFDIWFKNTGAGNNGTVTAIGVPMTQKQANDAGLKVVIV